MTDMTTPASENADTPDLSRIIGVNETAAILGVTPRTVVRWAESGDLPIAHRTLGGHRRFHLETVRHKLEELKEQPPADG